jgi:ribosomal protein S18 acetylase RimI-like enzyme
VRDPEVVRDLYALSARRWVDEGSRRHFAFVPAVRDLLEPWYRLSFGASAALAIRETAVVTPPETGIAVRAGTEADLEDSARLDIVLGAHLAASPSFGGLAVPSLEASLEEWEETWDDERFTHFVAEAGGRIVGHLLLYRRPAGDLRVPVHSIDLANAATYPEARGLGAGVALAAHAITWAHEQAIPVMTTDWRMTNLAASRFWPRRGFRETFQRLYRSIP